MTLADYQKRRGVEPGEAEPRTGEAVHVEKHPGALEYAQIGAVLVLITAIEIVVYYLGLTQALLVTALVVFSASKLMLVVLWFMHLKFDDRLFSSVFVLGFLLALTIFTVAIATLDGKLV